MSSGLSDYDKKVRVFFLGLFGLTILEALVKNLLGTVSDLSIFIQLAYLGFMFIIILGYAAFTIYALSAVYVDIRFWLKKC